MPDLNFWEQKLVAFLHDPPSKALDISVHEKVAQTAQRQAGIEGYPDRFADHFAASADRIPFPYYRTSQLSCSFDGVNNAFHHPLGGEIYSLKQTFPSSTLAEACQQITQPAQLEKALSESERSRAEFFAHWRLWPDWLMEKDARCAFLPADTRIPDHTIFLHSSLVSALASCNGKPALLRFHLGPVQSFIAAARSTRDLWSGSFLLSWLITRGLFYLTSRIGPDSVIFPNLRKQPLFDLHWRKTLWDKLKSHQQEDKSIGETFPHTQEQLLTPNFPNVFLALVPAAEAKELAQGTEDAIRDEWRKIAASVWEFAFPGKEQSVRFNRQTERHLSLSWNVTPFPATLDEAEEMAEVLPDPELLIRFRTIRRFFEKSMPESHRDSRFYDSDGKLHNIGLAWSLVVARNAWELDAVRQTRAFDAWAIGGASEERGSVKDALNGKEEAIPLNGLSGAAQKLFKHNDPAGSTTLIKRLWHLAYLKKNFGFSERDFRMPNTHSLAKYLNDKDDADENVEHDQDSGRKYFAILAFDGDDMGKWVSGAKAPTFREQLANYMENGQRKGAVEYFERIHADDFLNTPRLLTPSYHLQFSEALSNFALYVAPRIVKAYQGQLIYAGGDDVLAMLPAANALECARDLQLAFSGCAPQRECGIRQLARGFLSISNDQLGNPIPFIVPGARATASVGIAMAHFKAPLQDIVREAQAAEKRAKKYDPGKNAFAISVFKHSGEISVWEGSFRESAVLDVFSKLLHFMDQEIFSARFPHRALELIAPYSSKGAMEDCAEFQFSDAVRQDIELVLERQKGKNWNPMAGKEFGLVMKEYLDKLTGTTTEKYRNLTGMLTVAAFLARQEREEGNNL